MAFIFYHIGHQIVIDINDIISVKLSVLLWKEMDKVNSNGGQ